MVKQTRPGESRRRNSTDASLTETHAAIILRRDRYQAESRLNFLVENARQEVAEEWRNGPEDQVDKIHRITHNEHYDIDQLGWEVYPDPNMTPAVRMVVVTPVPGWEESNLDEITREFIHEMKAKTIVLLEAQRQQTALTPREFTALFVEGSEQGFFPQYAKFFDVGKEELSQDAQTAREALRQAEVIHRLLPRSDREEVDEGGKE